MYVILMKSLTRFSRMARFSLGSGTTNSDKRYVARQYCRATSFPPARRAATSASSNVAMLMLLTRCSNSRWIPAHIVHTKVLKVVQTDWGP